MPSQVQVISKWLINYTVNGKSLNTVFDSASNRNEYQEYLLRCKRGRSVGMTILPPSSTDCHEMWKPQPPGTLRACPRLYRDCFTFIHLYVSL